MLIVFIEESLCRIRFPKWHKKQCVDHKTVAAL